MTEERKAQMRKHMRERRARFEAGGLCIDCGKKRMGDFKRCGYCHRMMLDRCERYKNRVGAADDHNRVGATLREVAAEMGITPERVRQLELKALRKLRQACRRLGIDASDITGAPRSMLERAEDWA